MRLRLLFTMLCAVTVMNAQLADLIIKNGNIKTMDDSVPLAEAVAVKNGRIIAVGSNNQIESLASQSTTVINAGGKLVLPGFIDNHTHFISGGFQLANIELRYTKNEQEFSEAIRAYAKRHPGEWITGGDWDHDRWPGGALPTKELADNLPGDSPVFVTRYDGHMGLANTRALALGGITRETKDPQGGTIVRDPKTGEPTGVLKDEAMSMVYRIIPDPSEGQILEAALRAQREAARLGVTSIQDITPPEHLKAFKRLRDEKRLTVRVYARLPIAMTVSLVKLGDPCAQGDEWIQARSLKGFADGSLGSSTALFFEPYSSDPASRGLPMDIVSDGRLEKWALMADRAGYQLSIHAIGDSANSLILDLYDKIRRSNPSWDRRFRVEHAQHIAPKDFRRFASLGVIASAQPYHCIDDGRWAENRIGKERCRYTYPFRTFLDNGVHLCFGSDWTVAPLNPIEGIYAAVTRRTLDDKNPNGWFPEQKLTVEEAVRAYTVDNAYAAFEEGLKGSISVGKLADFIILGRDIFSINPAEIRSAAVECTIVGGSIVHSAGGLAPQR